MMSGEHVLCLNEKPIPRKDLYWAILRVIIPVLLSSLLYLQLSVSFSVLSWYTQMMSCALCYKTTSHSLKKGVKKPCCQLLLPAITCLSCMELMCKCKFSSYCFLTCASWLLIAVVHNGDILIKSQYVDVFIYFHMRKLPLSTFKGHFLIQNTIL